MQECGGAAGGLSFSDNGGDGDIFPSFLSHSLSLFFSLSLPVSEEQSFYNGASWGLGA